MVLDPHRLAGASDEISGSPRLVFDQKEVPSQANCGQEFHGLCIMCLHGNLSVLAHEKECIWEVWEWGEGRQLFLKLAKSVLVGASLFYV